MRAETWYSDQEAVDAGLADEVAGTATVEDRYDRAILNIFKNTPQQLLESRAPAPADPQPASKADLVPGLLAYQRNRARLLGVR